MHPKIPDVKLGGSLNDTHAKLVFRSTVDVDFEGFHFNGSFDGSVEWDQCCHSCL